MDCPNCKVNALRCKCHVVPGPRGSVRMLTDEQYGEWKRNNLVTNTVKASRTNLQNIPIRTELGSGIRSKFTNGVK